MVKTPIIKNSLNVPQHQLRKVIPYLVIVTAVLAAWLPALGGHPLFSEEYHYRNMLNDGFYEYFTTWVAFQGVWRLLGQAINGLTTNYPAFCSFLAVFTHILTVCFFFRVSQLLLKKTGLSLVLALIMGIFPWGYQTIMNVMGYTPMLATTIFWGNLLLLLSFANDKKLQPYIFLISFLLTFITQFAYEILIFAFMVSGVILWVDQDVTRVKWRSITSNVRHKFSGLAPFLGGLSFLVLYKATYPETNRMYPPSINLESIFSVYYYQYTNYYIFQPWFNSDTRNLVFFSWDLGKVFIFILLLCIFIGSMAAFLSTHDFINSKSLQLSKALLPYILLLMVGASLLYVVAGGYTVDTRKKYALIPLVLLLFGWIWRTVFEPRFQFSRKILVILMTLGFFGISTTWLVTGVYLYEINRQDALAEFLVTNRITGDIQVELNPDIKVAWPTMTATLGFDMYDNWVFNFAPEAKVGLWSSRPIVDRVWFLHEGERLVNITQKPDAVKLYFDPKQSRWQVAYP